MPVKQVRQFSMARAVASVTRQAYTPQGWLGFILGLCVRIATRSAVDATFGGHGAMGANAAGLVVCIGTGVAAGSLIYLGQLLLGRLRLTTRPMRAQGVDDLIQYATTGLAGALCSEGIVATAFALAKFGGLAVAAAAFLALGIAYASLTEATTPRVQQSTIEWGRRVAQGIVFGVCGCILGLVIADLDRPHGMIVATIEQAKEAIAPSSAVAPSPPVVIDAAIVTADPVVYAQALKVSRHALGQN